VEYHGEEDDKGDEASWHEANVGKKWKGIKEGKENYGPFVEVLRFYLFG
jgi:hypothetical protein